MLENQQRREILMAYLIRCNCTFLWYQESGDVLSETPSVYLLATVERLCSGRQKLCDSKFFRCNNGQLKSLSPTT